MEVVVTSDELRKMGLVSICDGLRDILKLGIFVEYLKFLNLEYVSDRIYMFFQNSGEYICLDLVGEEAYIMPQIEYGDLSNFPLADNYLLGIFTNKILNISQQAIEIGKLQWMSNRILQNEMEQDMLGDRGFVRDGCLFWYRQEENDFILICPNAYTFPKLSEPSDNVETANVLTLAEMERLSEEIKNFFLNKYLAIINLNQGMKNTSNLNWLDKFSVN